MTTIRYKTPENTSMQLFSCINHKNECQMLEIWFDPEKRTHAEIQAEGNDWMLARMYRSPAEVVQEVFIKTRRRKGLFR